MWHYTASFPISRKCRVSRIILDPLLMDFVRNVWPAHLFCQDRTSAMTYHIANDALEPESHLLI